jgi:DNA polymerase III subunit delta
MIYKSYLIEENINLLKTKVLLIYGENLGLKNDLKKNLRKIDTKIDNITFTQEEILKDENNFFKYLFNASLFDEQKIFIIENANDKILKIIEEIENKLDDQKIYFFSELLDKKSKLRNYFEKSKKFGVIACYNDNEIGLKKIILERLKGFEGLNAENINIIINNSNLDRAKLSNELDKIKTYFDKKKIVNSELLELLNLKENDNFNTLKDVALAGNNNKTNSLLNDTHIESDKVVFYISSINQRLNKLNEISMTADKSIEQSIAAIKPPIFWKDKPTIIEQSKKWNSKKIKYILNKTFELEIKFKSNSTLNKNILIKKLLVDICNLANA